MREEADEPLKDDEAEAAEAEAEPEAEAAAEAEADAEAEETYFKQIDDRCEEIRDHANEMAHFHQQTAKLLAHIAGATLDPSLEARSKEMLRTDQNNIFNGASREELGNGPNPNGENGTAKDQSANNDTYACDAALFPKPQRSEMSPQYIDPIQSNPDAQNFIEEYLEDFGLTETFRSPEKRAAVLSIPDPDSPTSSAETSPDPTAGQRSSTPQTEEEADKPTTQDDRKLKIRFSDDTRTLMDFVRRVQLQKENESDKISAELKHLTAKCKATSPPAGGYRKALAPMDTNPPSPSPTGNPTRQGTLSPLKTSSALASTRAFPPSPNSADEEAELASPVKPTTIRRSAQAQARRRSPSATGRTAAARIPCSCRAAPRPSWRC